MSEPTKPDLVSWRKSSASLSGECIEVADGRSTVFVRDSKHRNGLVLTFSDAVWRKFITDLARRT